ncbi:MAG: hypothetical protein A2504_11235 [Bdellovibrionales bacterium RIFOXYD12_FULL_39_22]|nr:MAG: hypothetical protein A2385_09800 [Bdellovibrionales bacterium RIFOXYB1_FULL_39_21]OFZ44245.1 MAG: hypothetical protein A2485_07420 [Bdellovibrionales bacterium RIFOXYC12_FULL_39_17]OFZ46787.1 MAG: hypothetical protein A2404_04655 [Bdellovibrionales bacterium RIFOXYC1_FULL_39_130]OFZ70374.1 MAG: hypothetical protein A2451_03170 [Bdellovibrionales bacterium RIFOXYC2_FULL_39_8]OFZ75936.1 MAG: hypothetical protein A2560_02495 [Bdellovibrionales bacterium RIFOXYD1_FULL_39_84]OFZ95466.1 MAG:
MPLQFWEVEGYVAAASLLVIAIVLGSALLIINNLLGMRPKEKNGKALAKKLDVYECGVAYVGDAHQQFSVRYYLIGIIFLIFDVEIVFMYPWTLVYKHYRSIGPFVLLEMLFFILLLLGGYIYLRKRNAFNWD